MSTPTQAPLLRIPAKTTEEVDLAAAVGHLILNSYGQEPKAFAEQLQVLNRARQDSVRGAGSDATGRDLLFKWFHMLEMLELRFPELRAPFPWKDAFTNKPITQHSLAYEKASVIFNMASVLSSLGARTSRIGAGAISGASVATAVSSPISPVPANAATTTTAAANGTKLAYTSLRQSAGMLSYINENFLHAPSTDMSKDVVRWLVDVQLAQATEVFWERTLDEKKGGNLVTRIASQAAVMYTGLAEESKEWVGRSVFDRSWGLLAQVKAKYFASVAQYHRALVDDAAASHGSCLVRLTLAETLAKEAQKLVPVFAAAAGASSSTLPADAGSSLKSIVDTHLNIVSARKAQAVKDNDLIYHDILPTESTLPPIEPLAVAQPISIQDIYASAEVQKLTGATSTGAPANDLFSALVPLGVHEAASMYSEEKAKLVRQEGERCTDADEQLEAVLQSLTLPRGLKKFKPDGLQDLLDPGREVIEWAEEEIQGGGSRGGDGLGTGANAIDEGLRKVHQARDQARQDFDEASRMLDEEVQQCEKLRVRYGDRWTQSPSGPEAKALRSDIKSNRDALRQASQNDDGIEQLWRQSGATIRVLLGGREALEAAFAEALAGQGAGGSSGDGQLVDLLQDDTTTDVQRDELSRAVTAIEANLSALHRLKKDRTDALSELRSKIQTDDISHILILNRRATADAQSSLFQQELEKFRPLTKRIHHSQGEQDRVLAEIDGMWKGLGEAPAGRSRATEWDKKNAARERLVGDLRRAKDSNAQVRAGLSKGVQFYAQLQEIAAGLRRCARSFVEERGIERERLKGELELRESSRGGPPQSSSSSLDAAFGRMGMADGQAPPPHRNNSLAQKPPPLPPGQAYRANVASPPPQSAYAPPLQSAYATPPPPQRPIQASSPYDNLDAIFGGGGGGGGGSAYRSNSTTTPAPPAQYTASPPPPQLQQSHSAYSQAPPPPQHPYQYASSHPASPPSNSNTQRQPSLPPPPPQWQSAYSSNVPLGSPGGGPPPALLPYSGSYGQAPAPPHAQQYNYGASNPYGGQPPPPPPQPSQSSYQPQRNGSGPPPPPLPPQHGQSQYGQATSGYGAYGYPAAPQGYGQPPPPPPPQQQRWQPPY